MKVQFLFVLLFADGGSFTLQGEALSLQAGCNALATMPEPAVWLAKGGRAWCQSFGPFPQFVAPQRSIPKGLEGCAPLPRGGWICQNYTSPSTDTSK